MAQNKKQSNQTQYAGDIAYRGRKPDNQRIKGLESDVAWDQVDHTTRVNYMHNYVLKRWQHDENQKNGSGFQMKVD